MKKIKKLLSVILVATMVFATFSIGITASAESTTAETGTTADSPLEVVVTTNESDYGKFDVAEITVTVTNTSDETVENISAEAIFNDLAPCKKDSSETSKEVESLNAGESFSFSYKATLNMNNSNLSFFERFILWFVRLFNGGFTDEINIFNDNSEYNENELMLLFGGYTITNIIRYNYNINNTEMSDEEFDRASEIQEEVSAELSDIQLSDEYKNSDTEAKKDMIESKLYEFEKNGLIKDITYNDSNCLFSFEYSSGWGGGIVIENKHTDCYSISSSNSPVIFENRTLTQHINVNNVLFDDLDMLFVIGASANNDFNSVQYLTELANQYSNMGVNVQKKAMATVETYKNLSGYDFVYVMSHGSYSNNIPYICTTEIATYKKQNEYRKDLNSESVEIYTVDGQDYFWILPSFFVNNYQNNELDKTIFYLGYCCGLGNENIENHAFYRCLKKGGADTVIGFCNSVNQSYSNYFGEKLLHYLAQGYTIFDSYNKTIEILGENQEVFSERFAPTLEIDIVAYPIILGERNIKLFNKAFEDYGVFTATVIDGFTNDYINNVGVLIYTESGSTLLHLEKTNENGTFSIKLLPGKYSCELVHKNYVTKIINFSITKNTETFYNEPISLTPTTYLMGTVIDKSTNKPVENASVLLRLQDGSSGMYTNEYNCSTDEKGQFEINVPTGTYTYEINKLDLFEELYETATGSITVVKDKENSLGTIYLTPKNNSGGGSEDDRTVIDSGDCGADGDNVKWTLYADGELVISGSGAMADYYFAPTKTPWCANISSITKITVKNGVSSIGDYAFNDCINLNSITIANSVTSIGGYAFLACNSLESISIPNSVSTIYEGTFSSCTNLKSVTIPVSVTSIGDSAFYNCTNLENIYYVGSMAEWCSINFSIYYPNEYDSIADKPQSSNPLFYAKNLFISGELITDVEFPVEITEIKQAAFFGYTNLKSVIIPEGITKIGGGAFYACSSLEKVDISSSVTNITHYAFGNCLNLSSISFNSNSKLNYIGTKAFSNCKTLTKIEIPESVTKIDLGAFYGCSNLEYITIPHNVSTLGNYAFSYCYNLKEVVLSDSMNVIQDETFLCCDSLKTVIIPISIISVEMSAFSGCSNISDVYYGGTKEQWNSIADYGYNHNLFNATIHYNS